MTGVWVLLGVIAAVAAAGLVHRRRDGVLRLVPASPSTAVAAAPVPPELSVLETVGFVPDTADVTLVQFSSAFCQPCRATRAILSDVAATVAGVRHLEVDAESQLDAVRALHIMRTPTTLVVDRSGVVVQRAAGQPRKADVVAAVGRIVLGQPVTSGVPDAQTR